MEERHELLLVTPAVHQLNAQRSGRSRRRGRRSAGSKAGIPRWSQRTASRLALGQGIPRPAARTSVAGAASPQRRSVSSLERGECPQVPSVIMTRGQAAQTRRRGARHRWWLRDRNRDLGRHPVPSRADRVLARLERGQQLRAGAEAAAERRPPFDVVEAGSPLLELVALGGEQRRLARRELCARRRARGSRGPSPWARPRTGPTGCGACGCRRSRSARAGIRGRRRAGSRRPRSSRSAPAGRAASTSHRGRSNSPAKRCSRRRTRSS